MAMEALSGGIQAAFNKVLASTPSLNSPVTGALSGGVRSALGSTDPIGDPNATPITNKVRGDWNKYNEWLGSKGLKGSSLLDKGGLGYKYFDEYIKQNPNTSLSRDTLPMVRQELLKYRQWVLDESKKPANIRQAELDKKSGANEDNFMRQLIENEKTADPNLPGQHLTSVRFPDAYVQLKDKGSDKVISTEALGLVNTNKK